MTGGYLPGDRWFVVTGSVAAFLEGTESEALLLWRALSDGANARDAVDLLVRAALDDRGGLGGLGPFVLAEREPDGMRVLCRGVRDVAVRDVGGSVVRVQGEDLIGWGEVVVAQPAELTIGHADADRLLPVPRGVVHASAVRWVPEAKDAEPGAVGTGPDTRDAEPDAVAAGGDADCVVSRAAGPAPAMEETRYDIAVEPADPSDPEDPSGIPAADPPDPGGDHDGLTQLAEDLPIGYTPPPVTDEMPPGTVLAVLCPSGHANAPHSNTCRLCGQLVEATEPVPVRRPVLARIRLSTGDVVDVDRPVVLGRAPYAGRVAASDLPRLVPVPSPNQDISRAHAQIRSADWQLVVTDLDSTNGTTVRPPGRAPQRLHPGEETVVEPGWSVDLGDGVSFVVEALP